MVTNYCMGCQDEQAWGEPCPQHHDRICSCGARYRACRSDAITLCAKCWEGMQAQARWQRVGVLGDDVNKWERVEKGKSR